MAKKGEARTGGRAKVRYRGREDTLYGWSQRLGISFDVVKKRVQRGWDPVRALTTEVRRYAPPGVSRR